MGKPLGTILAIEPFEKQTEMHGIIIDTNQEHMPEKGKVLSKGDEVSDNIKVGDSILFRKAFASKVLIDEKEILLLEEKQVYYVL